MEEKGKEQQEQEGGEGRVGSLHTLSLSLIFSSAILSYQVNQVNGLSGK
jgi:hypothetical protein